MNRVIHCPALDIYNCLEHSGSPVGKKGREWRLSYNALVFNKCFENPSSSLTPHIPGIVVLRISLAWFLQRQSEEGGVDAVVCRE